MNMYYFGNSLEYIQAEYATSNRSTCKSCKQKINKEQLRLGLILDDDHFNAKYWYHLKCFQLKPRHLQIVEDQIEQKIYNIDQLEEQDYNAVIQHIKSELHRLKNKKKGSKTENKNKQNKKDTKKKQSKKGKKKDEDQSSQSQNQVSSEEQSFSGQSDSEEPKKKKKPKKIKKDKQIKIQCRGYTDSQLQQFQKLCTKYDGLSANELKQLLAKNKQTKNGTKAQLVQKCADGKILGQIPTCTACGGGRLKFDKASGIYTCPGYMQDTDFIRCNKKFDFSQVKRLEWIQ